MGVDYYKILQVDRNAKDEELRKAYHKLSMKWHPDKNRESKEEAEAKFKQIGEAYDVLTDPQKRAVYDQHGEEGLKGEMQHPCNPGGPDCCNGPTMFRFSARRPEDIFKDFFGSSSPLFGDGSELPKGLYREDLFGSSRKGGAGAGEGSANVPRKGTAIERPLPCSLEDLYKGATKKMKISRDVIDYSGRPSTVEEILAIQIKAGWKKGTKITFPEKGNEQQGVIPSDLVFIVDEKPHSVFKRDNNDLIFTQKIPLVEALTGYTAQLTTPDGRSLTVPIKNVISPTYEEVIQGEGMPNPKDPSKKGNLRIKFNIKFPTKLTTEQKTGLKRLMSSP